MAGFHKKTFTKHDDYMTPKSAWENIVKFIPKDKVLCDPFYGNGDSGRFLTELGFSVIHENEDFFENDRGEVYVTNPPFTLIEKILPEMFKRGKPFIMIMPASKIATQYYRKFIQDLEVQPQYIVPRKRIHFIKTVDGVIPKDYKSCCNFDCFYYTWKLNLDHDIIFNDIAVEMKPRITVKILKEKLKKYNLSTRGEKAELIERLEFHSHTFQNL